MKKFGFVLIVFALLTICLTGCGVKQEVYQEEFVRARELEVINADLVGQLEAERQKRTEVEASLGEKSALAAELDRKLVDSMEAKEELRRQLERCREDKDRYVEELDSIHISMKGSEVETNKLVESLAKERKAGKERAAEYDKRISELMAQIEKLRERISAIEADRAVLLEEREKLQREKREKVNELSNTYEGLLTSMKSEIEKGQIKISQLQGRLSVNLLNEILFASGSATVKEEGKALLTQLGAALEGATDKALLIEGHTDNQIIHGALANKYPTNWELSTARAVAVVRYLVEEVGVDPLRIAAVGYGDNRPVADNSTEEGRAQNRRIEIKLTPLDPEIAELFKEEAAMTGEDEPPAEAAELTAPAAEITPTEDETAAPADEEGGEPPMEPAQEQGGAQ